MADEEPPSAGPSMETGNAMPTFGKVASKRRRKGVKRKRVDDEPEDSTVSVSDLIAEQKSRQRKQGIDALGTTAGPVAAQAAQERAALDSASQKEGNSSEPIISKSLAAEMEARAAKMEGLLSTGGGFRVEAKNRLDLDADNNPVMMQYIQQRLAQMKGEDKPAFSPEKGAPDADDAYALPAAAAAALAEVQAAKKRQETAATPLMMNIGLAEVELPDTYKARNEQETKRAMQMHLMASASQSTAAA